jgi:2,4-dienoyl-CoA reductase-like NADH-dependent reductase (Old Yellow Enzyme family)
VIVGNYGYTPTSGLELIKASIIDAITFGRLYLCNPDLAERIVSGVEISENLTMPSSWANRGKNRDTPTIPSMKKMMICIDII